MTAGHFTQFTPFHPPFHSDKRLSDKRLTIQSELGELGFSKKPQKTRRRYLSV